jgi:cytochrome P460
MASCQEISMNSYRLMLIVVLGLVIVIENRVPADPPKTAESEKSASKPFHDELLKAAADYKTWGRVDDENRWAPELCRTPNPGLAYVSASKDEKTHGQKLYSLFARKRVAYCYLERSNSVDVGQVIVKQSWIAEEITAADEKPMKKIDYQKIIYTPVVQPGERDGSRSEAGDHFYPYAWKGDKVFKAGKQADLFIMMKLDPKTPDTDAGWVYGTVTADGKQVTSAGKVESCMKCHREAKHDRLFGVRQFERQK